MEIWRQCLAFHIYAKMHAYKYMKLMTPYIFVNNKKSNLFWKLKYRALKQNVHLSVI